MSAARDAQSPAERFVADSLIDESGVGKPLSERAAQRQRSVESYLRGEVMPRYMSRARDIERGTAEHLEALEQAYARLRREGLAPEEHARRWTETARGWDFREVNALIEQHNAWYPIERDLPMDPRTGDYVQVSGRPYRRDPLTPEWVLERFPARS